MAKQNTAALMFSLRGFVDSVSPGLCVEEKIFRSLESDCLQRMVELSSLAS